MYFGLKSEPSILKRLMQQVLLILNPDSGCNFVSAYIYRWSPDLFNYIESTFGSFVSCYGIDKRSGSQDQSLQMSINQKGGTLPWLCDNSLRAPTKWQFDYISQGVSTTKNLWKLKRFLGLASYYRRFVPQFTKVAQTIYCLTHIRMLVLVGQKTADSLGQAQETAWMREKVCTPIPKQTLWYSKTGITSLISKSTKHCLLIWYWMYNWPFCGIVLKDHYMFAALLNNG